MMTKSLITVLLVLLHFYYSYAQIDSTFLAAIRSNDTVQVDSILSNTNIDLHATDEQGANALMWACHDADSTMVAFLFDKGAEPPENGWIHYKGVTILETPIAGAYGNLQSVAAGEGKVGILRYLLEEQHLLVDEQPIHPTNDTLSGWTALMHAGYNGQPFSLEILLYQGVNREKKNKHNKDVYALTDDSLIAEIVQFKDFQKLKKYQKLYTQFEVLNNLVEKGSFEDGLKTAIDMKKGAHDLYEEENEMTFTVSKNIGVVYYYLGQYEEAIKNHQELLITVKEVLGEENIHFVNLISEIGTFQYKIGQMDDAINNTHKSLELFSQIFGKQHKKYANELNNLASIYMKIGKLEIARKLYEEAIDIDLTNLTYKRNLANLYNKLGLYENAIPINIDVLNLTEQQYGSEHYRYALALESLGKTYLNIGPHNKAIETLREAVALLKKTTSHNSPRYIITLGNYALALKQASKYQEAISIFNEQQEIILKKWGKQKELYYSNLINLSSCNLGLDNCQKAIQLGEEALLLMKKEKDSNYKYGSCANTVSAAYFKLDSLNKAEEFILIALKNAESSLGKAHLSYINRLNNYSEILIKKNNIIEAENVLNELQYLLSNVVIEQYPYASGALQISWKKKLLYYQNKVNSFYLYEDKVSNEDILLTNIYFKESQISNNSKVSNTNNSPSYTSWLALKKQIGKELSKPIAKQSPQLDSLQQQADQLEIQLLAENKEFRKRQNPVTVKKLRQKLQENEAIVDIIHFDYYDIDRKTDTVMYVAYIVKPNSPTIQQVQLCDERQLTKALQLKSTQHPADELYASRGLTPTQKSNLNQLSFIWEALLPHLEDVKTIRFSPSGLLGTVNLGAIPINDEQIALDKFEMHQYTNFRSFLNEESSISDIDMLLVGGVDYDNVKVPNKPLDTVQTFLATETISSETLRLRSQIGNRWAYLPQTAIEVQSIAKIGEKQKNKVLLFQKDAASEAIIKQELSKETSPNVVHFSTHGFFYPDIKNSEESQAFKASNNPLIRSGLLLSGANHAWQNGEAPKDHTEDGILTAYEVANLNLNNTELAILSACETGLGDINGSEGIFGLQRAFKIAGANYILMSLWKVSDKHTQEIMSLFYKNWLRKEQPIPVAFSNAQQKMRKKYKNPQYWAGFVLTQ